MHVTRVLNKDNVDTICLQSTVKWHSRLRSITNYYKKILAYLANACTHPNWCHRGIIKKLALMVVNTSIIVCTCPTAS